MLTDVQTPHSPLQDAEFPMAGNFERSMSRAVRRRRVFSLQNFRGVGSLPRIGREAESAPHLLTSPCPFSASQVYGLRSPFVSWTIHQGWKTECLRELGMRDTFRSVR